MTLFFFLEGGSKEQETRTSDDTEKQEMEMSRKEMMETENPAGHTREAAHAHVLTGRRHITDKHVSHGASHGATEDPGRWRT